MGANCSSAQKKKRAGAGDDAGGGAGGRRASSESVPYGEVDARPNEPTLSHPASSLPPPTIQQLQQPPAPATQPPTATQPQEEEVLDQQTFPETVFQLLRGRNPSEQAGVEMLFANISKQVTIYTISTEDWLAERKFLMENVFSGVREMAQKMGYALNFVDLHWALNYQQMKHAKTESLSRLTIDRLKTQGKLVALVLLDEKARHLQYTLPAELPEDVFNALLNNCTEHSPVVQRFYKVSDGMAKLYEPRVADITNDLHSQLVEAFLRGLSPAMKDKYLVSLIESELKSTVFAPSDLSTAGEDSLRGKHAIWVERRAQGGAQERQKSTESSNDVDSDGWQAKRYNHLRGLLEDNLTEAQKLIIRQTNTKDNDAYLKELTSSIRSAMEGLIKGVRDEDMEVEASTPCRGIPDSLFLELCEQFRIKETLLKSEEMTTGEAEFCKLFSQRLKGGKLFVIHSNKEVGHMAAHMIHNVSADNKRAVLFRYCNRTVNSSTLGRLVRSLQEQLCFLAGKSAKQGSASLEHHKAHGHPFSVPTSTSRNLQDVVFILDMQFGDDLAGICDLVPEQLPSNVSVVLLAKSGSETCAKLKNIGNLDKSTVELTETVNLELSDDPVFELDKLISSETQKLFEGLLVSSRYGMMERDIMDLLSTKPSCYQNASPMIDPNQECRHAPYSIWAVYAAVNSHRLIVQNHAGRVIYSLLKADPATPRCHDILYDYFDTHWNKEYSTLIQDEVAYQKIRNNKMVPNTYYDMDYLLKRLCQEFADPYSILEELEAVNDRSLRNVLERASYALRYDATQLQAQMTEHLAAAKGTDKFEKIKSMLDAPTKVSTLMPLDAATALDNDKQLEASTKEGTESSGKKFSNFYVLKDDKIHVVSNSEDCKEICVWSIVEQKAVRRLYGLNQPRDLRLIDNRRALVLCNRELRVYDLDAGQLLVKLKGVMNQQMAYFGLHSSDYVVSLSRNRMYVNMMNLTSGDLETTFKVGEDRFLNSLLVSGNGRICVCGDETQKPFPLLVWDLEKRKLLYDLRIAHHEFLTRMSAISSDGHYVVCVCRELSDSAPNFIIVYDLQSGTLFKKWKPQRSSVSIAVSSQASLVINGLDNAFLIVWDLTTGQRKHTLKGHTAPVDEIRLESEAGSVALTYSSQQDIDGSVRMWDVDKGVCLAVYTPSTSILCAQIMPGGECCVLALEGRETPMSCMLVHKSETSAKSRNRLVGNATSSYGSSGKTCLEVELKDG
ncbi:uncharacterized protein LOC100902993 [Galendromus occidentalis]|uniref:Uncharacterized protein LOC100902993 n=1 Tax=Galendromus occidentalis TaxID=34638 RepID=A0AAJ6QU84_9ACAR|nr:uncharacterized protein LOC100902993 [Galendromus occidentalis]